MLWIPSASSENKDGLGDSGSKNKAYTLFKRVYFCYFRNEEPLASKPLHFQQDYRLELTIKVFQFSALCTGWSMPKAMENTQGKFKIIF